MTVPVRVLHAGPDHERDWPDPGRQAGDDPERVREGMSGNLLPVRGLFRDHDAVLDAKKPCRGEALRMRNFDYVRPATIADAIAAASEPGAAYLAPARTCST